MTVKERIKLYIKYKGINASEFGRSIGVSAAYISSMVKSIQPDKLKRITLEYPDLNTGWLLTGEGSMLKDSDNLNNPVSKESLDLKSSRELNNLTQGDLSKCLHMDDIERLKYALKQAFLKRGIYLKADMADYLGYKSTYFSGVINGKEKLSEPFLKNISEKLGINTHWILTGEGSMLKDSGGLNNHASKESFDLKSFRILNKLTQDDLSRYFQVPLEWISEIENNLRPIPSEFLDRIETDGVYDITKGYLLANTKTKSSFDDSSNFKLIPLINMDIVGGVSNDVVDTPQYVTGYMPFVNAKEGDICCAVTGRSMYPLYPGGCIVQLRKIERWRDYLEYGQVYVIDLEDGRRLIKEIRKGKSNDYFLLASCNKEFEDREIPTDMIYSIWLVIAKYEKSTM